MDANDFKPGPWFFRTGFVQTIAGKLAKFTDESPVRVANLVVTLADGDRVSFVIDYPHQPTKKVVCALLHGLGGSADSNYNRRLSIKLRRSGYVVARFNHRGCGSVPGAVAKSIYHCGSTEDVYTALKELRSHFEDYQLLVIGFSLSGAILLNLLGDRKSDVNFIDAALSVCPPLDLEKSSKRLSRIRNFLFDQYFTNLLKKQVRQKELAFNLPQRTRFPKIMNLRVFDEIFTAPTAGFRDRADYYQRCSPVNRLPFISRPTTIIGAVDDPIVCDKDFRVSYNNNTLRIILSRRGGHMGFVSANRTQFNDRFWLDDFILKWVDAGMSKL